MNIVGGLLVIILGFVVILWIKSPRETDSITDINGKTIAGSISTIEKITLGGQEQYLSIRGADITKPVMLFLHGGPGTPEIGFMKNVIPFVIPVKTGKGDLNNKFRILIFRSKLVTNLIGYETKEILLWLCLGHSWFQEIFINTNMLF